MNTKMSVLAGFLTGLLAATMVVSGLVLWWDPVPPVPADALIHNPGAKHKHDKPRPAAVAQTAPSPLALIPAALTGAPPQEAWLPRKLSEQEKTRRADADRALLQVRTLAGARMPNIGFLRGELGDGNYDLLESQLTEALGKELADPRYEQAAQDIARFNEDLGVTSDEEKPLIDAWVKKHPASAWAHYAEAARLYDLGWKVRGDIPSQYLPPDLKATSHGDFVAARNEVHKALKINPGIPTAWVTLIEIDRSDAGLDAVKRDYSEALPHFPASFMIRSAYMGALRPQWYGSYDAMEDFARQESPHADANPRIWALQAEPYGERGCIHCNNEDWQTALKLLNQALLYSDNPSLMEYAGESAMHLHRYGLAYQYYLRASLYGGDDQFKSLELMGLMQSRCDPKVTELSFMSDRSQIDSVTGLAPMDYSRVPGDCAYHQAELPWGDETAPSTGSITDGYDLHMEYVMASFKKKH